MVKIDGIQQTIPGIGSSRSIPNLTDKTEGKKNHPSFADTIGDFVSAVNDSQKNSSAKVADVIQGKSDNLVEAMTAMEESKLSFELMLEIRNKLLESYQEIQRMQV